MISLKTLRKNTSENVVCFSRQLHIFANIIDWSHCLSNMPQMTKLKRFVVIDALKVIGRLLLRS